MKDFFKFTLASCLGLLLAAAVMFIILILSIGLVVNTASNGMNSAEATIQDNSVLVLDLNRTIPELTNNAAPTSAFDFENSELPSVHDIKYMIEEAKEDHDIKAIFIKTDGAALGLSNAEIIRKALLDFKTSDKPIYSQSNVITQKSYYIASVADRIFISPTGIMDFRGFSAQLMFFKKGLDKIGIEPQIYYAGKFKSATEPFRRSEMSPENREQTRVLLDEAWNYMVTEIASARNMTVAQVKAAANDLNTLMPETCLSQGLVTDLGYKNDAFKAMKAELGMDPEDKLYLVNIPQYSQVVGRYKMGDGENNIAIVYAEGEINDGEATPGVITADQYVKTLRQIQLKDNIKAVVLRVNSPGGSVISSDNIWKAVEELQETGKPVVVSMGDYAASGGYYIACGSDKIFAQPMTITGSIGVFSMGFNLGEALEDNLGITFDTVNTGKYSSALTGIYQPSTEENAFRQKMVDQIYSQFLARVSEGREMSVEAVNEIAQGRVWTGQHAKTLGLVDEIGTLEDAVVAAAELAELEDYRAVAYPSVKNQWEQIMEQIQGGNLPFTTSIKDELKNEIKNEAPFLKELMELKTKQEVQARMMHQFNF